MSPCRGSPLRSPHPGEVGRAKTGQRSLSRRWIQPLAYQVMSEQHQAASLPQTKHVGNLNPKLGAPGVGETWWFCPWAVFPCLQPRSSNSHSKLCTQAPRSSWRAGALYVDAVAVRVLHPLGAEFCSSSNLPVLHGLSCGSGSSHQPPRWGRKWGVKMWGLWELHTSVRANSFASPSVAPRAGFHLPWPLTPPGVGGAQCSGSVSTLEEKCQQLPLPL